MSSSCCLQHDEIGQATILNLLLRNLLSFNRTEQAHNFVTKTNFPESASNNQLCRYLYYTGKIQAIQLDYSSSFTKLQQAYRKAPQNTGLAFKTDVQKLYISPERAEAMGMFYEQIWDPKCTRDSLRLWQEDCVLNAQYGERTIKDLGVKPRSMEREAFNYLIRFRKGGHFIEL